MELTDGRRLFLDQPQLQEQPAEPLPEDECETHLEQPGWKMRVSLSAMWRREMSVKLASLRNDQACDVKLIVINVDMIVDLTQLVWYRSRGAREQLPKMTDDVCRSTRWR